MFLRLGKWLIVCALVFSTGCHWFALQSVAWVTMVVSFAQTESLEVAISKTFDGKNPCRICKTVAEGRESEQKEATIKLETKLDFCVVRTSSLFSVPPLPRQMTAFIGFDSSRTEAPPSPPPKAA